MEKEILNHISELKKNISIVDLDKLDRNWKSYGRTKELYNLALIRTGLKSVRNFLTENNEIRLLSTLEKIEKNFEDKKIEVVLQDLEKLEKLTKTIKTKTKTLTFSPPLELPLEIKDDILEDINELERCFNYSCFRSSIILCGRLLEISLHRKYYEITKNDLLEKSPGIGLGKIIAKLKEKKVNIAPGLSQQIHLINQTRIFSVHKKSSTFTPNKDQTHAIILFTLDILEKLFK
ncbi:MAG: hypothetical protein CMH64_03840 [Nanoarchaeota archaeon]|nr:hypothetical protein [Nanoarchaeota archaeon]|tara:strand:+ start:930 stop:1631 length:702 start_codon:yes stop_codon:yes gene_type:complete